MKTNQIKTMIQKPVVATVAVASLLLTAGCGPNYQAQLSADTNASNGLGNGGSLPSSPDQQWKALQVEGTISSGEHKASPVIRLDKPNKMLLVSLPMPLVIPVPTVTIPELDGGKLTWDKMPNGSPALTLHVPLEKVLRGVDFPAVDRLPTGERLADLGVPDGELPSFAISLPIRGVKAHFFIGAGAVAVFVNTPWSPPIGIGPIPVKDSKRGTTLGYFALIPGMTSKDGGVYVSAQMPAEIAAIIDDIL